jgi:hypothetical protein
LPSNALPLEPNRRDIPLEKFYPMSSKSLRNWRDISRNLTIVASMADRFLELSPEERQAMLCSPTAEQLRNYSSVQLAATIRQAKDIVRLLETAEAAWKQANKTGAHANEGQAK